MVSSILSVVRVLSLVACSGTVLLAVPAQATPFLALALQTSTSCQANWVPTFGGQPGVGPSFGLYSLGAFDDGSGAALHAGGYFTAAGGTQASSIAALSGLNWSALGSGLNDWVSAQVVFDDGSGPALYVCGGFTTAGGSNARYIAKWNGAQWSALGSGLSHPGRTLCVFDDGTGPALYVGGEFDQAGGAEADHVAKWDGSTWTGLGLGLNDTVNGLTVFDDGSGPALCAGGFFYNSGGVPLLGVARWNGTTWASLGSAPAIWVNGVTVFDNGTGPALHAFGGTTTCCGPGTGFVSRWNGSSWVALGTGMNNPVDALAVFDDGSGAALYAGGRFTTAEGSTARNIARWDGTHWLPLGSGLQNQFGASAVRTFTVFDDGSGAQLYVGGGFKFAGGLTANNLAKWDGANWSVVGSGVDDAVYALKRFDVGTGSALYAGGTFTAAGGSQAGRLAQWNGSSWTGLNTNVSVVFALEGFDDGTGPALFVGGGGIAKWNGTSSIPLVNVFDNGVLCMKTFDDGTGTALYVGGGSTNFNGIAKWNGTSWSGVGGGLFDPGEFYVSVRALTVFDDGTGPALVAGGNFLTASGITVNGVARWNGTTWSALGAGLGDIVQALEVFDDGSGPALYAGGSFSGSVKRWNGSTWTTVGAWLPGYNVSVLKSFDDGSGSRLFAGGSFIDAGGVAAKRIAKWNGTTWSALGAGVSADVLALEVFEDGAGPALYAGGGFALSPAGDSSVARWGSGCMGTTYCAGDGSILACPCANESPVGAQAGCRNSLGLGATMRASGQASLAHDSAVLLGDAMPDGPLLYFQGSALSSAITFGDGLKCTGGALIRLGIVFNSNHASTFPPAGGSLSASGLVFAPGTRHYQARYRDAATFCTADTFNYTSGVSIVWAQ